MSDYGELKRKEEERLAGLVPELKRLESKLLAVDRLLTESIDLINDVIRPQGNVDYNVGRSSELIFRAPNDVKYMLGPESIQKV